jgi:hypothetical protein
MDHKEQHHLKHLKERQREKQEHHHHEQEAEKSALPFHPAWLVAVGAVLVLAAVVIWTVFLT